MKTESSTNSPTATLAPTKSQRDPVGLQATSPPSHLTGDLRAISGQGRLPEAKKYTGHFWIYPTRIKVQPGPDFLKF